MVEDAVVVVPEAAQIDGRRSPAALAAAPLSTPNFNAFTDSA